MDSQNVRVSDLKLHFEEFGEEVGYPYIETEIIGKSVQFLEPKKGNYRIESEPKVNEDVRDTSFSSDIRDIPFQQ